MTKVKTHKTIRKGDKVIAIAGNYKGQTGEVISRLGDKIVVQGLNVRKKHVKKSQTNPHGGIVELEKGIHVSNLKVLNAENKPVKLKAQRSENGHKELVYKQDDKHVVHRAVKQTKSKKS
ncbi:MAG: 50S ribosomal protein L24 [Chlamydiales bacterium 38-26]|nr:50S ribosomal protein L24 [Chlamydiales bacterium]OJV07886.1 MAG: 50S ribosomal protein L24 [Chlamydiales bacterium 38-26]